MCRTDSMICGSFYEKAPLPILCPAVGPQCGNICRPVIWKYSVRRHGHPIHRPAADNSHCRCCSIHVPAFESGEIVDSLNGANLTFRYPFSRFVKKGDLLSAQTTHEIIHLALSSASSAPVPVCCAHDNTLCVSVASPSPPVPPASVPAWGYRTCQ